MKLMTRATLVATGILVLGACTLFGGEDGGPVADLDATWRLQRGTHDGQAISIVPGSDITLTVTASEVGGRAACNIYGGTIEVDGQRITISALSMTEMACQDDVMAAESAYLAALGVITTAAREGNVLTLTGTDTELRFILVPAVPNADFVGTTWVLDSLISGEAMSSVLGEPAELTLLADGTLSGSTGCRTFTANYSITGSEVRLFEFVNDDRGCADNLQAQDDHVLGVLGDGFTVAIAGSNLTLTAAGGLGLGYRAE